MITFGVKSGTGAVATVPTSTPTYTASALVTDSAGASLTNSPLVLAAGKKF